MNENLEILRNVIIRHLRFDPKTKSRIRDVIDVKKIFCLIAYNNIRGFRYQQTATFLGVTHATIIHHVNTAKDLMMYDVTFKEMYDKIDEEFMLVNQKVRDTDIESEIKILSIKLERLQRTYYANAI